MSTPLVVANWKMHGGQAHCARLARQIVRALRREPVSAEIVLAPPFTALNAVHHCLSGSPIKLAAQNCHWESHGAYTGEVSPMMLSELGCAYVIVGHSERRQIFHESDAMIARKLAPVLSQGIRVILCVGETLDERQAKKTAVVIRRQLRIALKGLTKADIANTRNCLRAGLGHRHRTKRNAKTDQPSSPPNPQLSDQLVWRLRRENKRGYCTAVALSQRMLRVSWP